MFRKEITYGYDDECIIFYENRDLGKTILEVRNINAYDAFKEMYNKLKTINKPLEMLLKTKSSTIIISLIVAVIIFILVDRSNLTLENNSSASLIVGIDEFEILENES